MRIDRKNLESNSKMQRLVVILTLLIGFEAGCATKKPINLNVYNYDDHDAITVTPQTINKLINFVGEGRTYECLSPYYVDRIDEININKIKPKK